MSVNLKATLKCQGKSGNFERIVNLREIKGIFQKYQTIDQFQWYSQNFEILGQNRQVTEHPHSETMYDCH